MYSWSKNSARNIKTVHEVLQILSNKIITKVKYDIGVLNTGGKRTPEMQNEIFKAGNSKCDGYKKKSYHQSGLAIDYVPYINGNFVWNNALPFLENAKVIFNCWDEMQNENLTQGFHLHWGGFWGVEDLNDNGKLDIDDKLGWDMAHFELRNFPQIKTLEFL